jgi:hypothetical protein
MTIYTQKITFDEMRASGARDICHRCWHNVPTQSWPLAGSRLAVGYRTAVLPREFQPLDDLTLLPLPSS